MIESLNRAFMYGESVFTTLRLIDGVARDWDLHFDRLKRGVEYVWGPFPDTDWAMTFKDRLETRLGQETDHKIIRITAYRNQERGLQPPTHIAISDVKFHISSTAFDPSQTVGKKLKLRTFPVSPKPSWWPSHLKAGNYLPVILAQKLALKAGDDDLLFISPQGTVLESSVANVFVVRHNRLYTAPLGPDVLDGIMRRKVIERAELFFDEVIETETTLDQLYKADAVFGTNSVRGPFLIDRIDDLDIAYGQGFLERFEALRNVVLA